MDNDNLHGEIEEIEAPLVVVPSRVVNWSRGLEHCATAEGSPEAQESCSSEQNDDLRPPSTRPKLLNARFSGHDQTNDHHRQRQECDEHEVSSCGALDVDIDFFGVEIKGVERLDGCGNDDGEQQKNKSVEDEECPMKCPVPAKVRMRSSDYSLRKDEVDEQQNQNPGAHEDHCCNSDRDVVWVASPNNPHDAGHGSRHTETEQEARHEEFVAFALVRLEDEHVADCSEDEEK